ncbi:putative Seed maturation protein [Cocos nucifera]|uniref:Putative Seed maturation protein n=1 Tax=Cocos nucifera TaxID=13894 RepID=A0A8K0HXD6_COCNU|nr:putative Seed maturation protein [Cocos nucifera]
MAQSKDDIKYGAAQAKLSEDEMLRVRYKHGTPLEGGKIADSEPVDLYADARRIAGEKDDASKGEGEGNKSSTAKTSGS